MKIKRKTSPPIRNPSVAASQRTSRHHGEITHSSRAISIFDNLVSAGIFSFFVGLGVGILPSPEATECQKLLPFNLIEIAGINWYTEIVIAILAFSAYRCGTIIQKRMNK